MPDLPPLILASTSVHRRTLLQRLGLPFTCVAPLVDESERIGETPVDRAQRLAGEKAQDVARRNPIAIVIGSDQVASLNFNGAKGVLHKPGDRNNCRSQLLAMSGQRVRFDTAVTVAHAGRTRSHCDLTWVQLRTLTVVEIDAYMDREPAFDCAGGFKCEGLGASLFESIQTSDPTALIGLPLIGVCAALRGLGYAV